MSINFEHKEAPLQLPSVISDKQFERWVKRSMPLIKRLLSEKVVLGYNDMYNQFAQLKLGDETLATIFIPGNTSQVSYSDKVQVLNEYSFNNYYTTTTNSLTFDGNDGQIRQYR